LNPLLKARDRVGSSLRTARDGTTRTAGWVKDGVGGGAGKTRGAVVGLVKRSPGDEDTATKPAASGATAEKPASDGPLSGVIRGARENRTTAIAWAAVALFVVAWIAWTVYVWIENGSTAGVGVLVSWPAVIAAVALICAPFVGVTLLFKRMGIGEPQVAGAAGIAESSKGSSTETPEKKGKDEKTTEAEAASEQDEAEDAEDESGDEDDSKDDADSKDEAAG
jgi:hypothetical protein